MRVCRPRRRLGPAPGSAASRFPAHPRPDRSDAFEAPRKEGRLMAAAMNAANGSLPVGRSGKSCALMITMPSVCASVEWLSRKFSPRQTASRGKRVTFNRAIWLTWWLGAILIVLSWFRVVSNLIGWCGFGACGATVLIQVLVQRYWKMPPPSASDGRGMAPKPPQAS